MSPVINITLFAVVCVAATLWKMKRRKAHALHDAAADGNLERIGALVASGFAVDTLYDQVSALHVAVMKNQAEAAKKLLDLGASVNLKTLDETGVTPLHLSATTGNADMAALLFDHGADLDIHASNGEPPLLTAARYGHQEMVDLLVSRGADLQATSAQGNNLLFMCIFANDTRAANLLLDAGMNPNVQDKDKRAYALHAAMIYAIHSGNTDMVECLLAHGADPDVRDQHGMTPLKMARIDKRDKLIDLLTAHGAGQGKAEKEPT